MLTKHFRSELFDDSVYGLKGIHYLVLFSKSLQSTEISLYLAFTNELNVAQEEINIDE
jgi:hypothetical protein